MSIVGKRAKNYHFLSISRRMMTSICLMLNKLTLVRPMGPRVAGINLEPKTLMLSNWLLTNLLSLSKGN
jgi:hypothetical protein